MADADNDIRLEVKTLQIQVEQTRQMLEGIQDHYRKNLVRLREDLDSIIKPATELRNSIGDELHFMEGIDTFTEDN